MKQNTDNTREITHACLEYVDYARGIVILLMMIGHLVPFDGRFFRWIFSFHMPFFFFISGYLNGLRNAFEGIETPNFGKWLFKITKSYLIVNIAFSFFLIAIGQVPATDLKNALYYVFISPLHEWFLPAFFFAQLLFWLFLWVRQRLDHVSRMLFVFLSVAVIYPIVHLAAEYGWHDYRYFPVKVLSSLVGLTFIIVGNEIGRWIGKMQATQRDLSIKRGGLTMVIISAILLLVMSWNNTYLNLANMCLGKSDILYLSTAVFWSVTVLLFARKLEQSDSGKSMIRSYLAFLGRHTLFFYLGQTVSFHFLGVLIARITGITYTPMVDFPWYMVMIYLTITVIVLSLLCRLKEMLKKAFRALKAAV